MITVCCSAPEGQISLFSWDLDQFNQRVMMVKDVNRSVQRCLSRGLEVSWVFFYCFSTLSQSSYYIINIIYLWDIIVKYCRKILSPVNVPCSLCALNGTTTCLSASYVRFILGALVLLDLEITNNSMHGVVQWYSGFFFFYGLHLIFGKPCVDVKAPSQ